MYNQIPDLEAKIEKALEDAYQVAFVERDEFFKTEKGSVIDFVISFLKENNIVIATNNNIIPQKVKNNKVLFESYKFTLFTTNALILCNDLINYLFTKTDSDLLMMRSLSYNEFVIKYDDIDIVLIYGMPIYQNINLLSVMNLESVNDVKVIPCEIEIINCYKKISDLSNDDDYFYYCEKELFERFMDKTKDMISGGTDIIKKDHPVDILIVRQPEDVTVFEHGTTHDASSLDDTGDAGISNSQSEESRKEFSERLSLDKLSLDELSLNKLSLDKLPKKELPLNMLGGGRTDITELREIIVEKFINRYGCLIGEAAINTYEHSFENISHVDLKLNFPFEAVVELDINVIVKELSKLLKLDIQYKNNVNRLPFDFRNIRHTISYDENILCHIYNDATYNVVPYTKLTFNKKLYNVAMPSLIMKYLFINLWVDKFRFIVKAKKPIDNTYIIDLIDRMHLYYEKFDTMEQINKSMDVFYMGVYLDELTAKKKKMRTDGSYPFYVKNYFLKYGKLRTIENKAEKN